MYLPTNVSTGKVAGRFIVGVADGPDPDDEPDALPARGKITFTSSVPYLPSPTAAPSPATVLKVPIIAVLDDEGFLCTPDPADPSKAGQRGIRLIATDDPDLSVQGWTWTVTYAFEAVNGVRPSIQSHAMALPAGAVVDLTSVVKVPSSTGIGTEQAEALVSAAQAAAAEASLAASLAADAAQATDTGVATLVSEGTATSAALAARYVIRRVWDGTAYPRRVDGGTNIFIGPQDPGLSMTSEDLWVMPASVTSSVELQTQPGSLKIYSYPFGTGNDIVYGWGLPDTSNDGIRFNAEVPPNWTSVRFIAHWVEGSASGGAARFSFSAKSLNAEGIQSSNGTVVNRTSVGPLKVNSLTLSPLAVTPGDSISGGLSRIATSSDDTIQGHIGIMGVKMERLA